MTDAPRIRIGDRERDHVAEALRVAAGEGRIEPDELDDRLEAAYRARYHDDLVPLLDDLPSRFSPQPPVSPVSPVSPALPGSPGSAGFATSPVPLGSPGLAPVSWYSGYLRSSSVLFRSLERTGVWGMAQRHYAVAVGGYLLLDLREARFPSQFVRIEVTNVFGTVEVIVHPGTAVDIPGTFVQQSDEAHPEVDGSSPVVRITGTSTGGRVVVRRRAIER